MRILKFDQEVHVDLSSEALDTIRKQFFDHGLTVVEWARAHQFDVHLVYGVLSGRTKARRGESHRIAVALGLKPAGPANVGIVHATATHEDEAAA